MPEQGHESGPRAEIGKMEVDAVHASLRSLLPPAVAVSVRSLGTLARIHAREEEYIKSQCLHPNRAREFRAGRACAHQALSRLEYHDAPILPGADREPLWPSGLVGSITHSRWLAAAAVAPGTKLCAIGIDLEEVDAADDTVAAMIMSAREHASRPHAVPSALWRTLHFSAKESVFKASFPHTRRFLEFQDIDLEVDVANKTYCVRAAGAAAPAALVGDLQGRWAVGAAHVISVAFLAV